MALPLPPFKVNAVMRRCTIEPAGWQGLKYRWILPLAPTLALAHTQLIPEVVDVSP